MKVLETVEAAVRFRQEARRPLGLVPTMGYLHEGHLTLVRCARRDNPTVAVSIFVNPTQFGPNEDFTAYPRDMQRDLSLLEREGVDVVFAPTVQEMYPKGFDTFVEVGRVAQPLEGAVRPSHFRGVATVVTKLFAILRPDAAYFGQKDAQQVAVIKRLNADLNLGVDVMTVPTVREADGLAMSSRNVYLSPQERQAAPVLYRALSQAQALWRKGEQTAGRLKDEVRRTVEAEPLARLEYVSVADAETMQELDCVDRQAVVSLAARFGKARLIDNVILGE